MSDFLTWLDTNGNVINIVIALITAIITGVLIPLLIALPDVVRKRHDAKVEHFKRMYSDIDSRRADLLTNMQTYYDKRKPCRQHEGLYLLKPDFDCKHALLLGGTHTAADGSRVANVVTEVESKDYNPDWDKHRSPLLPDPKYSYSHNIQKYLHSQDYKSFYNGKHYFTKSVTSDDDSVHMRLYRMTWFDFYNTSKILELEASSDLNAIEAYTHKDISRVNYAEYAHLHIYRLRDAIEPFDLTNRGVATGVNTLTVFLNVEGKDYFLLHKRSAKVSESAGRIGMIPAGFMQPISFEDESVKVRHPKFGNMDHISQTMLREFCEELLGREEFEHLMSIDYMYDDGDFNAVADMGDRYLLGFGLEPINLHMEVLTAFVVDCGKLGDVNTDRIKTAKLRAFIKQPTRRNLEVLVGNRKDENGNVTINYEGTGVLIEEFTHDELSNWRDSGLMAPAAQGVLHKAICQFFDDKGNFTLSKRSD